MKISRQQGTINERLSIFVQDATVSTGQGLANLEVSSFSSYWFRDDNTSTSSVTLTSSTAMGTYSSGAWTQVNSTFARGWYQFGCPNGVFASSRSAAIHMYGHPSMAPVPIEVEITKTDNQTYVSSQPFNISTVQGALIAVAAPGIFSVGRVGVSSFNSRVGVSSIDQQVGVSTFDIRVGVSSFDVPVGVSSMAIGVGVTTFNSRVGVSSFDLPVGVSSMAIGVGVTTFNSRVGVSSFDIPVGVSSMAIGVGVTTFNSRVGVSSFDSPVGISTMQAAVDAQITDRIYGRNIAGGSDGGRTLTEALYLLRNRSEIAGGVLTVYGTDDATSSWAANVTTTAGNPISQIDPT